MVEEKITIEEDNGAIEEEHRPHKLELKDRIYLSTCGVIGSLALIGAVYLNNLNHEREARSWKEFDSAKRYFLRITENDGRVERSCTIRQRDGNAERLVIAVDGDNDKSFDQLKLFNVPKDHDLMRYASFGAMENLYAQAKKGFKKEEPRKQDEVVQPEYTECDLDYFPELVDKKK